MTFCNVCGLLTTVSQIRAIDDAVYDNVMRNLRSRVSSNLSVLIDYVERVAYTAAAQSDFSIENIVGARSLRLLSGNNLSSEFLKDLRCAFADHMVIAADASLSNVRPTALCYYDASSSALVSNFERIAYTLLRNESAAFIGRIIGGFDKSNVALLDNLRKNFGVNITVVNTEGYGFVYYAKVNHQCFLTGELFSSSQLADKVLVIAPAADSVCRFDKYVVVMPQKFPIELIGDDHFTIDYDFDDHQVVSVTSDGYIHYSIGDTVSYGYYDYIEALGRTFVKKRSASSIVTTFERLTVEGSISCDDRDDLVAKFVSSVNDGNVMPAFDYKQRFYRHCDHSDMISFKCLVDSECKNALLSGFTASLCRLFGHLYGSDALIPKSYYRMYLEFLQTVIDPGSVVDLKAEKALNEYFRIYCEMGINLVMKVDGTGGHDRSLIEFIYYLLNFPIMKYSKQEIVNTIIEDIVDFVSMHFNVFKDHSLDFNLYTRMLRSGTSIADVENVLNSLIVFRVYAVDYGYNLRLFNKLVNNSASNFIEPTELFNWSSKFSLLDFEPSKKFKYIYRILSQLPVLKSFDYAFCYLALFKPEQRFHVLKLMNFSPILTNTMIKYKFGLKSNTGYFCDKLMTFVYRRTFDASIGLSHGKIIHYSNVCEEDAVRVNARVEYLNVVKFVV